MKDAQRAILRWRRGQTMTETILLLPLYLVLIFGLLQICQLGTALIMANYAASKVARNAVRDDVQGGTGPVNLSGYQTPDYMDLMIVNMKPDKLEGCIQADGSSAGQLRSITVRATAIVPAFPI